MKEFLSREQVPFDLRNVDVDLHAYDELVGRGWRSVPVTFFGETAVKGFDLARLNAALHAWRAAGAASSEDAS